MFERAKCKTSAKWCSFKQIVSNDEVVIEYCIFCKREVQFPVIDGRVNNTLYRETHMRDFCQPYGATRQMFIEIYGMERYHEMFAQEKLQDKRKRNMEALDQEYKKEIKKAKLE